MEYIETKISGTHNLDRFDKHLMESEFGHKEIQTE